jgi:hypothetical protein
VNDYGTLAERLKLSGHAEQKLNQNLEKQGFDAGAFFEAVKVYIGREIEHANGELHKRRLSPIERVFVPCYLGRLCLTFGAVLMCCVELDGGKERITATIFGPPNRQQISKKKYYLGRELANQGYAICNEADRTIASQSPEVVAGDIVSEILKTGIRLIEKRSKLIESAGMVPDGPHFAEFWISLASLLRSYTALHGLSGNCRAEVEAAGQTITVRQAEKWLILKRHHAIVTWTRENGSKGAMEFTDHGTLRSDTADEAMDMVAEQWARELTQREPLVKIGS